MHLLKMSEVDDWQNMCKDNKSRAKHILQNKILTDCQFLVGPESDKAVIIRGHKLILAMASPVFQRMFYGIFEDEKSNEIRIPDIKHNIFHMMMAYIYFEKLEVVTVDDAIELYSAAKKYMLQDLMKSCIDYLNEDSSVNNVWKIYEFAVFFDEKALMTTNINYIAWDAVRILKETDFLDANLTSLIALFERDALNIDSELELFNALNEYALTHGYYDTKDSLENKEVKCEIGKRKLIKEALQKIRFLCLTPEEFETVAKSGLLTDLEVISILLNIINPDITDRPIPEGFSDSRAARTSFDLE